MKRRLIDKIVDALASGNRPIRILLFGGVFFAWIIMTALANIFGVETETGGDVNLSNVILIIVSILTGFSAAYGIVHFLESSKQEREADEQ